MTHLKVLLEHPRVEAIYFPGTSPVMVRTKDGRRIPATQLPPGDGQPEEPG